LGGQKWGLRRRVTSEKANARLGATATGGKLCSIKKRKNSIEVKKVLERINECEKGKKLQKVRKLQGQQHKRSRA